MGWIALILLVAGVIFAAYALASQWGNTDPTLSKPGRAWAAIVAAASIAGAAIVSWLHTATAP